MAEVLERDGFGGSLRSRDGKYSTQTVHRRGFRAEQGLAAWCVEIMGSGSSGFPSSWEVVQLFRPSSGLFSGD